MDAAGKTTLADALAEQLMPYGRQIIRASIDGFHNPRVVRRLDESPAGFFQCSFNYAALREELLAPLGPQGSRLFRRAVFNFRTDQPVFCSPERAEADAILLFDGIFLLRSELREYWDFAIFVEADFAVTVSRAETRDRDLLGDPATVRRRYESRYVPGQLMYLERERPRQFADVIVVNNDFENPQLQYDA